MGKYKYEHYSMKDQEDWTDKDWEMYFRDMDYNEETARMKRKKDETSK